jgi:hypothetical protein
MNDMDDEYAFVVDSTDEDMVEERESDSSSRGNRAFPSEIYLPGDIAYGFWNDDTMYYRCRIRSYQRVNEAYDVVFVEDGKQRLLPRDRVVDAAEANRR